MHCPWLNDKAKQLIKEVDDCMKKYNLAFMAMLGQLIDEEELSSLYDIPYIKNSKDPDSKLLAIILQNAYHDENSKRVKAIQEKDGNYIDFVTVKECRLYISGLLSRKLVTEMRKVETQFKTQRENLRSEETSQSFLMAPNVFMGAAILQDNYAYNGKGDFKRIIDTLCREDKFEEYKERAIFPQLEQKLMLLMINGLYLSKKYNPVSDFRQYKARDITGKY